MVKGSNNREEMSDIKTDVRSMASSIGELKHQLSELQVDVKTLITTINEHHTEKELVKKDLVTLESRVQTCEDSIKLLFKKNNLVEKSVNKSSTTLSVVGGITMVLIPVFITVLLNKLL